MEKQYSLFYTYRKLDDVFAIVFHGFGKVTSRERRGNVEALFDGENLCGYNIYNIKDIVKIKVKGLIFLPNSALIDLINHMLINAKFDPIPYIVHSGFIIGKVMNSNEIDIGGYLINCGKHSDLPNESLVVVAVPGTMLPDETLLECGHICTYKDLSIEDKDEILVLDEEYEIGSDFFQTKED